MTQDEFIKSPVFLQLGQAIEHENWQSAMMKYRRLEQGVKECDISEMKSYLTGIKMSISHRDKSQAQNILARIIAVRVKILREMPQKNR